MSMKQLTLCISVKVCDVIIIIGANHFCHGQPSHVGFVHIDNAHVPVPVSFIVNHMTVDLVVRNISQAQYFNMARI